MNELLDLKTRLQEQRPASWEELPDIPLYMDQVLALMHRQTIQFDGEDKLTAAMVNNYIKDGVAPRAAGKRYGAEHLAYLTMICVLKQVLPVKDVALLISREMETRSVEENYDRFRAELSSALNSAADLLPDAAADAEDADIVGAAMNYALLSYAFGLAGRRLTSLLRQEAAEPAEGRKHHRRKKKDGAEPEEGAE